MALRVARNAPAQQPSLGASGYGGGARVFNVEPAAAAVSGALTGSDKDSEKEPSIAFETPEFRQYEGRYGMEMQALSDGLTSAKNELRSLYGRYGADIETNAEKAREYPIVLQDIDRVRARVRDLNNKAQQMTEAYATNEKMIPDVAKGNIYVTPEFLLYKTPYRGSDQAELREHVSGLLRDSGMDTDPSEIEYLMQRNADFAKPFAQAPARKYLSPYDPKSIVSAAKANLSEDVAKNMVRDGYGYRLDSNSGVSQEDYQEFLENYYNQTQGVGANTLSHRMWRVASNATAAFNRKKAQHIEEIRESREAYLRANNLPEDAIVSDDNLAEFFFRENAILDPTTNLPYAPYNPDKTADQARIFAAQYAEPMAYNKQDYQFRNRQAPPSSGSGGSGAGEDDYGPIVQSGADFLDPTTSAGTGDADISPNASPNMSTIYATSPYTGPRTRAPRFNPNQVGILSAARFGGLAPRGKFQMPKVGTVEYTGRTAIPINASAGTGVDEGLEEYAVDGTPKMSGDQYSYQIYDEYRGIGGRSMSEVRRQLENYQWTAGHAADVIDILMSGKVVPGDENVPVGGTNLSITYVGPRNIKVTTKDGEGKVANITISEDKLDTFYTPAPGYNKTVSADHNALTRASAEFVDRARSAQSTTEDSEFGVDQIAD